MIASWIKGYAMKLPILGKILIYYKYGLSDNIDRVLHRNDFNIVRKFPTFAPMSPGSYKDLAQLTIKSASQTFEFMVSLIETIKGVPFSEPIPIETFSNSKESRDTAINLKILFDKYGSDKATRHNYHHLYAHILVNQGKISNLLELGIGTNNKTVVSNMGIYGSPGASLRAFRDFLPNSKIYGADIDKEILFQEKNIKTFFVDQTDIESFVTLSEKINFQFDLIIDDGLHSPNANIATLIFANKMLRPGGWFVVEDVNPAALPIWRTVSFLLPSHYSSWIISAKGALLFAIQRNGLACAQPPDHPP
jgi:SAM-dependent methyltransferase